MFGNQDEFEGLGIFLDTFGLFFFLYLHPTSSHMSRYSNAHHDYAFPRIVGILGDGKTKYNYGDDGDKQAIGACSVSPFVSKHLLTTYNNNDSNVP